MAFCAKQNSRILIPSTLGARTQSVFSCILCISIYLQECETMKARIVSSAMDEGVLAVKERTGRN